MLYWERVLPPEFSPHLPAISITKKIRDIMNQATPINARPKAACFKIVNPALYLSSLPAAVTIWNPHRRRITRAISAIIPSTQLINHLTTLPNESCWPVPAPITFTFWVLPHTVESVKEFCCPTPHCAEVIPMSDSPQIVVTNPAKSFFNIVVYKE